MKYRKMGKTGVETSALGYGCMRYPKQGSKIDEKRTMSQIGMALDAGVNYFDTAYIYLGGQSEAILGKALGQRRNSVFIADKIPPYLVFSRKDMDRLLDTMLKRLGTDRIDFLLAHALNDHQSWERLVSLGYADFLEDARRSGKIRYAGFSWHGALGEFKKTVDDYPWDFCQIQYNYLDERFQAGTEGLEYAAAAGLGVSVMEPLRGGSLVGRMPQRVASIMDGAETKRSPADWALNWVWDRGEVSTVLSGLNEEAHIKENIELAERSEPGSFTESEKALVARVRDEYRSLLKVGCTGCAYCMPCPHGVDIPNVFAMRNNLHLFESRHMKFQYTAFTAGIGGGKPSSAASCVGCGICEKKCPQGLEIRKLLAASHKELSIPALKPALGIMRFAAKTFGRRNKRA